MNVAVYLDPARWQGLELDALYSVYADGRVVPSALTTNEVYEPTSNIPVAIMCRVSDSEKRLDGKLEAHQEVDGAWGSLHQVTGNGADIGFVLFITPNTFDAAHVTPDMVHLLAQNADLRRNVVVKSLYEARRALRLFRFGPYGQEDTPHDLIVVTKARWFRARNNPKFLGFSKDEKP